MYFRRKTSAGRTYLQIVESRRDGEVVRQQVIATLGRFDALQASGQLERLVRSGARFAGKAMVLSAAHKDAAIKIAVRRIGPALVFERLWEETGCRAVITGGDHGAFGQTQARLCAGAGGVPHGCAPAVPASPRSVTPAPGRRPSLIWIH
jgi:hypothetical protein